MTGMRLLSKQSRCAGDMQLVESVPLLPNSKKNAFIGVNLYVDDTGSLKKLPINERASDICRCCSHHIQVRPSLVDAMISVQAP
jgi:hypothetical protein